MNIGPTEWMSVRKSADKHTVIDKPGHAQCVQFLIEELFA
mgnify:CR=1 FL=1